MFNRFSFLRPISVLAVSIATILLCACASTTPSSEVSQIEEILDEAFERQGLVGLQATVIHNDDRLLSYTRGFAELDHDSPVTRETKMPIASVMKAITGVVYLRLHEQGIIDPATPVHRYVPEFPEQPETPITLDHLINQTHGIRHYRDEFFPAFFTKRYDDPLDVLDIFAGDDLVARTGERFTYSSYAYTLLAAAIERASGESFWSAVERFALGPARMTNTVPNHLGTPIPGRARPYAYYEYSWPFEKRDDLLQVPSLDMSYNPAGGNTLSSTDDLARFGAALLDGTLLSKEAFQTLTTSQKTDDGEPTGWSHGWFVIGHRDELELRINGSNPGSWAHLSVYPESGIVISIATNTWGRGSREATGLQTEVTRIHDTLTQASELDQDRVSLGG